MHTNITLKKAIKRKEYNSIRYSNSLITNEKIKSNVQIAIKTLLQKYHTEGNHIGIYWPLKGEVDIRFIRDIKDQKVALPSSSKPDEF